MAQDHIPRRIVSLQPSCTVTIERLGMLDRLVACTKYCLDVCPQAAGRAIVADSWTADREQILAANPDLVLASVPYQHEAVSEILQAGIPFVGFAPKSLNDVYSDIMAIARLLGAEAKGEHVVVAMKKEVAAATARTRNLPHPRVYCEEWGKPLIHSQRWVAELVEAVGGMFLGEPGKQTTAEAVKKLAPEVILAAWCGAGDRVPLEKIVASREWEATPAAKTGRVFCLRDELLNTPAPTLMDGLRALGAAIRPEIFGEKAEGLRRMTFKKKARKS